MLGLDWENINLTDKIIIVSQQRQRVNKKTRDLMKIESKQGLLVVDPKTTTSKRVVPIPPSVVDWLKEERERNTTRFLIPNTIGTNSREKNKLTEAFNALVVKAKIKPHDADGRPLPMPTFHDLRHTFCTRMANDYKVLPNVLMRLAGHSRIETTLGFYVHVEDGDLAEAMNNVP